MAPLVPPRPAHPPPPNWPSDVHYLTAPFYSAHVPPAVIQLARSATPPPQHKPATNVEIRFVTDPKHPACGQRGLFAKRRMAKGELVVWYTGAYHLDPEPSPQQAAIRAASDYDLCLVPRLATLLPSPCGAASSSFGAAPAPALPDWAERGLCIDASQMGNEARFCNDYRGTPAPPGPAVAPKPGKKPVRPKAKPNAFFHSVRTASLAVPKVLKPEATAPLERMAGLRGELRMGVFVGADEGIEKGQEILISYGKSFWRSRGLDVGGPVQEQP